MTIEEDLTATLSQLHDAVFLSIDLPWAEGTARLRFRLAHKAVCLAISGVSRVELSRQFPWGRSECVNEVRVAAEPPDAGVKMDLEMQSGDRILISGSAILAERSD